MKIKKQYVKDHRDLIEYYRGWLWNNNQRYYQEVGKQISKKIYGKDYASWQTIDEMFIAIYEWKLQRYWTLVMNWGEKGGVE